MNKLTLSIYSYYFFKPRSLYLPIWTFFYVQHVGFSLEQATLLFGLPFMVSLFFEIASGYISDLFSRKKVLLFSVLGTLINFSIYIFAKDFSWYLFGSLLYAVSIAFESGTIEAISYENIRDDDKFKHVIANAHTYKNLGRVLGNLMAGFLYAVNPVAPFLLCSVFAIAQLIALHNLKDCKAEHVSKPDIKKQFKDIKKIVVNNQILTAMVGYLILLWGCSNVVWTTFQVYLEKIELNYEMVGAVYAVGALVASLGPQLLKWFQKRQLSIVSILKIAFLFFFVVIFLSGSLLSYLGAAFLILRTLVTNMVYPLQHQITNRISDDSNRATLNSVVSFVDNIIFSSATIPVGFLLNRWGLGLLLQLTSLLAFIAFLSLFNKRLKNKPSETS